jgi:L-type amino acid transporter 9
LTDYQLPTPASILVAAGHEATRWTERGIALGGGALSSACFSRSLRETVIVFVTLLHGFTPRFGILLMNMLSIFKIIILLFVVVSGWVVLSGHTQVKNPHANFRNAFAGSSHSSNDVSNLSRL